jgi:hypothetical protein
MVMAIMIIPIATATITMAILTKIAVVDGLIIVAGLVLAAGMLIVVQIVIVTGLAIVARMVIVAPENKVWLRQGWHCLFCYPLTISTNNL